MVLERPTLCSERAPSARFAPRPKTVFLSGYSACIYLRTQRDSDRRAAGSPAAYSLAHNTQNLDACCPQQEPEEKSGRPKGVPKAEGESRAEAEPGAA